MCQHEVVESPIMQDCCAQHAKAIWTRIYPKAKKKREVLCLKQIFFNGFLGSLVYTNSKYFYKSISVPKSAIHTFFKAKICHVY